MKKEKAERIARLKKELKKIYREPSPLHLAAADEIDRVAEIKGEILSLCRKKHRDR